MAQRRGEETKALDLFRTDKAKRSLSDVSPCLGFPSHQFINLALNNAKAVLVVRSLSWLRLFLQMWLEGDRPPLLTAWVTVKVHDIDCMVVSLAGSDVEARAEASALKSDLPSLTPDGQSREHGEEAQDNFR